MKQKRVTVDDLKALTRIIRKQMKLEPFPDSFGIDDIRGMQDGGKSGPVLTISAHDTDSYSWTVLEGIDLTAILAAAGWEKKGSYNDGNIDFYHFTAEGKITAPVTGMGIGGQFTEPHMTRVLNARIEVVHDGWKYRRYHHWDEHTPALVYKLTQISRDIEMMVRTMRSHDTAVDYIVKYVSNRYEDILQYESMPNLIRRIRRGAGIKKVRR